MRSLHSNIHRLSGSPQSSTMSIFLLAGLIYHSEWYQWYQKESWYWCYPYIKASVTVMVIKILKSYEVHSLSAGENRERSDGVCACRSGSDGLLILPIEGRQSRFRQARAH